MGFEKLLLAHGGGGEETLSLIKDFILKYFTNPILEPLEDAALLTNQISRLAFTIDGFTVKPIFFKGGNIGKLAVTGTVNDLVVMGAKPLYLTVGFIIEEGFKIKDLEKILQSMQEEAIKNEIYIVAGDTKIVPKSEVDGIFITTSGIGEVIYSGISCKNLKPGDVILVSGPIGDHGACILAEREGIKVDIELESDCETLWPVLKPLFESGIEIHAMRDPTRGGLAATLHEWAYSSQVNLVVDEEKIPVRPQVKAFCEALGFEPYHLACEGRVVIALPEKDAEKALEILRSHPSAAEANIIGQVLDHSPSPQVYLKTLYGTHRVLENTSGELFPRIC
ncbi:hydrogenase expression/formation protein HypE [Thermodesulfobacterium sp.]|jgi:hydrogenase expression/formation protein HypE|uniref:hydrogenase expression/formation protein HypE n=1 Tax=Thermodesulfobacterium sp. TaxID=1965289 RepID=UPI00264A3A4D|nr:hydrogenase expression/formation protein HypE [Thermodesulfobacterium sp.]MDN5379390.1 hydrogenase expression/formation protein HypE [Thermodesulfobacterium sp.]